MAHATVTITDDYGQNERTYTVTYIHLADSHNELESHIQFTEEWDEIEEIFDEHGNPCLVDQEEWQRIADEFYRRPGQRN